MKWLGFAFIALLCSLRRFLSTLLPLHRSLFLSLSLPPIFSSFLISFRTPISKNWPDFWARSVGRPCSCSACPPGSFRGRIHVIARSSIDTLHVLSDSATQCQGECTQLHGGRERACVRSLIAACPRTLNSSRPFAGLHVDPTDPRPLTVDHPPPSKAGRHPSGAVRAQD